jgi:Mg2+ and Co2+ transporter CorA
MFSDRLVAAVSRLDISDAEANRVFRRDIRHALENFLRFEHRYWFYEISNQAQARELYAMTREHLGLDALYRDIREELHDMGNFLDVEAMRRQNETVVRLTVVTTFGLIGTVCTGFLGMNLLAWADHPLELRALAFFAVTAVTTVLTAYTVAKSRRLSEFFDALSDEHVSWRGKLKALREVWPPPPPRQPS